MVTLFSFVAVAYSGLNTDKINQKKKGNPAANSISGLATDLETDNFSVCSSLL